MSHSIQQTPTMDDLRALREQIIAIAARNRASHVRVFGSVARGDATVSSDIDFLVTFEKGASIYDMSGIELDLRDLLGVEVDVADDQTKDQEFLDRIQQELIPL